MTSFRIHLSSYLLYTLTPCNRALKCSSSARGAMAAGEDDLGREGAEQPACLAGSKDMPMVS